MAEEQKKIKLFYWPIHGLAGAIRLTLLHAVGVEGFEDKHLSSYEEEFLKSSALAANPMLNIPWVEFPDGTVVTQSNAILKALGRRYNLNGSTLAEQDLVDEVLWQLADFHVQYVKLSYECPKEKFAEWLKDFDTETLPYYFGGLDKILAARKVQWFGGSSVSVADFKFYAYAYAVSVLHQTGSTAAAVEAFPNLKALVQRLEALPAGKAFLELPMSKLKVNGSSANWGG